MDIVELVREEWSSLGGVIFGIGGVFLALFRGEWYWAAACVALVFSSLRVLQLTGWIRGAD